MKGFGSLRKLWAFASSRNFSVFILVMGSTYVLVLAVFRLGFMVEERWLDILVTLWPFKLLFVLFFLNLLLFQTTWLPSVLRRCQRVEPADRIRILGRLARAAPVQGLTFRQNEFERYLKRRGYYVYSALPGTGGATLLYACSGRFSLLGNVLFHLGFVLLLLGAVTNALYRFQGTAIIAEGGSFTGSKNEYRVMTRPSAANLPDVDFDVEKISAEFWDGKLLFTRLDAQLRHRGGRDIAKLTEAARVGDGAVTISGYDYAPKVVLKNKAGEILRDGYVKLHLFGGSEDYFYASGYPHKIFVSFYPDHAQVAGKLVNKSMNPVNPAYYVRVLRGRLLLYSGVVTPGAWVDFDGLSLSFPSFVRSGDFLVVRNPGNPWIWAAFIVMVLGLVWRLLFYRKEVLLWQDDAGQTWLSGRFDYYPKLHAAWLASLADKFRQEAA